MNRVARILNYSKYYMLAVVILYIAFTSQSAEAADSYLIEDFANNSEIPVIVELYDDSGLNINLLNKENINLFEQKKAYFRNSQAEVLSQLPMSEFKLGYKFNTFNMFSGNITKRGIGTLNKNTKVKNIYPDTKKLYLLLSESVPKINANKAYNLGFNGSGITICVIDSGIDYTHPNLGGCTKAQFLAGTCGKVVDGYDYVNMDSDPMDDDGHGTHVAGIIANTDSTYTGIAPGSRLTAVKVCDANGCGPPSRIVAGIDWCRNNSVSYNISIITMSIGDKTEYSDSNCPDLGAKTAINTAVSEGIFVDVASGNDEFRSGINWPACVANSTSVGATDKNDRITWYSNAHANLDLLAPGGLWGNPTDTPPYSEIVSTFSKNVSNDNNLCFLSGGPWQPGCNDDLANVSTNFIRSVGTSMAAPHVAGVAALLQQAFGGTLTPAQIETALKESGVPVWDSRSKRWYPRVDALAALAYVKNLQNISHIDWPTDHHDFRRTGFTLLRGDVNKASDVNSDNVALKQNIQSDILIRPSVADLDSNGHQEVVTVMYELGTGNSNGSELHAVERQRLLFGQWFPQTKERWKEVVPVSYPLLPPTLANIDTDSSKEVLIGLENGTLITYDVTNSGQDQDAVEKWRYKFSGKYSVLAGMTFVRFGGGTAVDDIDLDGNKEILTADMGNRGTPDWPGEVYIIDGITGAKEGNATFGNGGAFASVSVANVDTDDNPEIIVPSFYGVFVYDYNPSAPNKLTLKCSTYDGMIDGSVVVYDVDKDNQYELVYTTTTLLCDQSKTCYNRLYIKNAQTCADEGPSPISLSVYSRVTPTIANLDSDSNYEIVISGRLNTQTEDGKIIAYDASTGAQQWSYDDSGTLKTAFVAPDIADMNGDGRYDIVFGENNGSKVHIVNSSGGKNFTYNFNAFIDSALAIGDIDGDGKAEIALKREGSPYGILAVAGSFNRPPQLGNISNITARVGELIDLNRSGEIAASDPDGNTLTFSFSSPFNSSGEWQTTVNDTGNYSVLVEVSDGSLTDYLFVDVYVFNQSTQFVGNFSDGFSSKLLNYTAAANKTISVRLPKNATIVYSRIRLEGRGS